MPGKTKLPSSFQWSDLLSFVRCPFYEDSPQWKSAKDWYDDVGIDPVDDSEKLLDHARRKFELAESTALGVDVKSDGLMKLCASLLGALFAVAKALEVSFNGWFIASAFLLLLAMLACLTIRIGILSPTPPVVRELIDFKKQNPEMDVSTVLAAAMHVNQVGVAFISDWKGRQYNLAVIVLMGALVCLFLGMVY